MGEKKRTRLGVAASKWINTESKSRRVPYVIGARHKDLSRAKVHELFMN